MQTLINKIPSDKEAWVALVPPVFQSNGTPNITRNQIIQGYNNVITNDLSGIAVGPDLYSFFLSRPSLFADTVHPNGYGHALIAYMWRNALLGNGAALPLIFENLNPLVYKQNLLEVGDNYYIDESFILTSIPSVLQGGIWIMTANADLSNTSDNFLSFKVDRNVTVYVAYDTNASSLPPWLLAFSDTGLQIGTTSESLELYGRNYAGGSMITLGGNRAGGGTGTVNYIVIVKEN